MWGLQHFPNRTERHGKMSLQKEFLALPETHGIACDAANPLERTYFETER